MFGGFSRIGRAVLNQEGGTVLGGGNGCLCPESRGRNGRELLAGLGIGRVELFWEGGFVSGGCYCCAFFLATFIDLTLSPSWCGIALPVYINLAVFGLDR